MNAFGLWTLSNRFDRREVNGNEMKGSPTLHSNAFHVKCDKKLPLNIVYKYGALNKRRHSSPDIWKMSSEGFSEFSAV